MVAAVMAELVEAGRLDTVLGQQALTIAEKLGSLFDTGSSAAALSKELRALMAEAVKGAAVAADPLDELRARRAAKRAG